MESEPTFWEALFESEAILLLAIGFMLGMFERFFDILERIWWWLIPFQVVDQFERGVILRWGNYNRTVSSGFRWMWPFGIEEILSDNFVYDPISLGIQSLHTSDGYEVNVQFALAFEIVDIETYLLKVEGGEEAVVMISADAVTNAVQRNTWKTVHLPEFTQLVKTDVCRRVKKIGVRVKDVWRHDCASSGSHRYWHEGIEIG